MTKELREYLAQKSQPAAAPLKLNLQFFADGDNDPPAGGDTKAVLTELAAEVKNSQKKLADALEQQNKEIKQFGQTSDDTANKIKEYEGQFETYSKELTDLKNSINDILAKQGRPGFGQQSQIKTAGQLFAESNVIAEFAKNGQLMRGVPIGVKSFHTKDLTSGSTGVGNGGITITPFRKPDILEKQAQRLTIRDLLQATPISTNAVEYVRETGFTNNAGIRQEGKAAAQSEIQFELKADTVKSISHWMPASREILADAPRLQAFIDNKMRYGIMTKEEQQILFGDGLGGNILGIMNDTAVQNIGTLPAGKNLIDQVRRSMTKVFMAEYQATGTVLHPEDWEAIELAKGDDGHYIWLNVGTGNEPQLFKVPVVPTPAMSKGDFLTGAFGLGATLYDREEASVRLSESHADFFTRGMVAIMAEERVALAIERPESFVKGKLTAPAGA